MQDLTAVTCVGYVRVSTERQAGEDRTSIADQETAIIALAARRGLAIGTWFRDEGASGGTAEGRPAFSELVESVEAYRRATHSAGYVLALNDSRFGRFDNPEEAAYWRIFLEKRGWIVRFAESDDSENVTLRTVMRAIGSAQASEYRDNIKRNARRGARGSAEQGFWTREAPIGYRRKVVYPPGRERILEHGELKAPNERVSLSPEESREAPIVRRIFDAFATGEHTLGSLARWLATEVPWRVWSRRHVQAILKNPVYCGDVVGGRRSKDRAVRAAGEEYGKRDAHPALITRATYEAVQARMVENKQRSPRPRSHYVLSGLVHCTQCGAPYVGGGVGGRVRPTTVHPDGRFLFYKDSSGANEPPYRGECPGPTGTIARHKLERAVIGAIAQELKRPAVVRLIAAEIDRALSGHGSDVSAQLDQVQRDVAAVQRKRERLVALVAEGTITSAEASAQLSQVRAELSRLLDREHALRASDERASGDSTLRDSAIRLALDFPRVSADLTGSPLRELIRPWLAFATFDKTTRRLTLGIRRVPAIGPLLVTTPPAPVGQQQRRGIVTREVDLSSPAIAAQIKRRAGG